MSPNEVTLHGWKNINLSLPQALICNLVVCWKSKLNIFTNPGGGKKEDSAQNIQAHQHVYSLSNIKYNFFFFCAEKI